MNYSLHIIANLRWIVPAVFFVASATGSHAKSCVKDLPAFCRVTVEIKPAADRDIKLEAWLPSSNWNGKFMAPFLIATKTPTLRALPKSAYVGFGE